MKIGEFAQQLIELLIFKLKRLFKKNARFVAFEVARTGHLQFVQNILAGYIKRFPGDNIYIVYDQDTASRRKVKNTLENLLPQLKNRAHYAAFYFLRKGAYAGIDLFIVPDQFSRGAADIFSVCIFHGQPSKGITFSGEIIEAFDAFFLYGPLHQDALKEFIREYCAGELPAHLALYEIGYTKSDQLLRGEYNREKILLEMGLNAGEKTILYAPAYDEGASLRECGPELVRAITENGKDNVIVKFHYRDGPALSDSFRFGGEVDWFGKFKEIEKEYPNFKVCTDLQIDSCLACSDVLITDISSASFEFLALNKPVIFINTPKFFSGFLKQRFPDKDTISWAERTTVNAGREFGLVVSSISELPGAIEEVLGHPETYPRQQSRLKEYLLYNRGKATEAALQKIDSLLKAGVKLKKPYKKKVFFLVFLSLVALLLRRLLTAPVKTCMPGVYAKIKSCMASSADPGKNEKQHK